MSDFQKKAAKPLHLATRRRGGAREGRHANTSAVYSLRVDPQIEDAIHRYKSKLEETCKVLFTRNDVLRHIVEMQLVADGALECPLQIPGVQSIHSLLTLHKRVNELEAKKAGK